MEVQPVSRSPLNKAIQFLKTTCVNSYENYARGPDPSILIRFGMCQRLWIKLEVVIYKKSNQGEWSPPRGRIICGHREADAKNENKKVILSLTRLSATGQDKRGCSGVLMEWLIIPSSGILPQGNSKTSQFNYNRSRPIPKPE